MSKLEHKWPRCPECGGRIEMSKGYERTREYRRGIHLAIPDSFQLPTCVQCHEVLMVPEVTGPLDEQLGIVYRAQLQRELEMCVSVLKDRHGVTQQDIEDACGVTRSYFSHLLAGRKEPSLMLMKLVRSFVIAPDAFEHARTHQVLNDYIGHLFVVAPSGSSEAEAASGFVNEGRTYANSKWPADSNDARLSA